MNGRLYDPLVGRFLSPDNNVQMPDFSQNFNRYSYCINNPLIYTDPSGEIFGIDDVAYIIVGIIVLAKNYSDGKKANNGETNPFNWNWKNAFFMIGNNSSLDGSSSTWSLGVGWSPEVLPAIGYNNTEGIGAGVWTPEGPNLAYSNKNKTSPEEKVNKEISEVRQAYGPAWRAATYGELRPYNPSFCDSWSESSNFFKKLTYDLADGISVTAQSFVRGPNTQHLNGSQVSGYDRMDGFVNTVQWGIALGEASSFNSIKGGFNSNRWGLRIQSHTHPINPISGRGISGSKAITHLNINKFHLIYNPAKWGGWSNYRYFPFRY